METPNELPTTMNATDMSFTFTPPRIRVYLLCAPYTITQGLIPATGLARVEAQAVTGDLPNRWQPMTWRCLERTTPAIVELLANDIDPMGGVLSVTSVKADAASGIKTGVEQQARVHITARRADQTGAVQFHPQRGERGRTSTGTIVLPPALTTANSVPKADNIDAQVWVVPRSASGTVDVSTTSPIPTAPR